MNLKTGLLIVVLVGLLGYAFGRYLQPAKVVTKTETKVQVVEVEVERVKTEVRTIVKETTKPDGTRVVETTKENISDSKKKTSKESDKQTNTSKIVENFKPQWRVQVAATIGSGGLDGDNIRVGIERRIIGPVFLGAWSETRFGSYGASVSMEF